MKKTWILILLAVLALAACARQYPTPEPTPTASVTPPRAGLLSTGRETVIYAVDRVSDAGQLKFLADNGVTHVVMRLNLNTYSPKTPTEWAAELKKAEDLGLKIVVWPGDWVKPQTRTSCNYESPFPRSEAGNIERVKPLLDVLVAHPAVVGFVTFHEAQYATNCSFPSSEIVGLKSQIDAYTTAKGRRIPIWGYVGNFFGSPAYWTPSVIAGSVDVAIQWKACAGRTDPPCSAIPDRIKNDRQVLVNAGLEGKVLTVFLAQSYQATYAPYNHRLSLDEYYSLFKGVYETNASDGTGFYTWSADWWNDISEWPEMWSIVSWVRNHAVNMAGTVPEATVDPRQTVTPVSTMFTSTPTAGGKSPTPSKTVVAVKTSTLTPVKTVTPKPTSTSTGTPVPPTNTPAPTTGAPGAYCVLIYPGTPPRVEFCP